MDVVLKTSESTSKQRRLPADCWDILKRLQSDMAGASYQTIAVMCLRVCKAILDDRSIKLSERDRLLTAPVVSFQANESNRLPVPDEGWALIREFSRLWNGTGASGTIANALRIVDSLRSYSRLPKSVKATLEVLGIV